MKRLLTAGIAAIILVSSAAPALAHVVYTKGDTWESGGKCAKAYSEISHGWNGTGYTRITVDTRKPQWFPPPVGTVNCFAKWIRPPYWIAVETILYILTPSGWAICHASKWAYNPASAHWVEQDINWNIPCSSGVYANLASVWVYYDDAWRGGGLWSGSHELPT